MAQIKYVAGDATEPISLESEDENKIIIHIVNNLGAFGAGFVVPLGEKYPHAKEDYLLHGQYFGYELGTNIYSVLPELSVVHLIAQAGLRNISNSRPLSYQALRSCLEQLMLKILFSKQKVIVHAPRIGCGLAGGEWSEVEKILNETLIANGIDVVIYDLPTSRS